jgi:hypothetical protein
MQPSNDKILSITGKASESIIRVTVVELLEDAIALAKEGATPDQLMVFIRGICVTLESARSLSMSHTGDGGFLAAMGTRLGSIAVNPPISEQEIEEFNDAYNQLTDAYETATETWEKQEAEYLGLIENLQAQVAQANAPKNGHRTLVEDVFDEEEDLDEEEEVVAPTRSRRGSSRQRVRGMLAARRSGRGFGRTR